jgi:hypothetical protein
LNSWSLDLADCLTCRIQVKIPIRVVKTTGEIRAESGENLESDNATAATTADV